MRVRVIAKPPLFFIPDENWEPVGVDILDDNWWKDMKMVVERDTIGPYLVSTIWLPLNHNFGFSDKPVHFETMIFDNGAKNPSEELDGYQERYTNVKEAREGHKVAKALVERLVK